MKRAELFDRYTYAQKIVLPGLACLFGFFVVTTFLFYDACLLGAKKAPSDFNVRLTPLTQYRSDSCIGITAQGAGDGPLYLFVNNRQFGGSAWGRMDLPYVKIPRVADAMRFVTISSDGRVVGEADTVFEWPSGMFPLRVSIARYLAHNAGLWISGSATPGRTISVYAAGGPFLGSARVGNGGLFSLISRSDTGSAIGSIRVVVMNSNFSADTAICSVQTKSAPIARTVFFYCVNADTLDKYAYRIDSLYSVDYTLKGISKYPQLLSKLRVSVELPAEYAGIEALQRGWMSAEEFAQQTVGDFRRAFFQADRDDPARYREIERQTPLTPVVSCVSSGPTVRVTIEKRFLLTGGKIGAFGDDSRDLPSTFLSQSDTMTIHLNGHCAEKIVGRLPDTSSVDRIVWTGGRGEKSAEYGAAAILLYRSTIDRSVSSSSDHGSSDTGNTSIKGFIGNYEETSLGGLPASFMRLFTWIVIFGAFIHFSRARRQLGQESAGLVGALSTIFLIWSILFYGRSCLPVALWDWAQSLLRTVIGSGWLSPNASYQARMFCQRSNSVALDSYAFTCAVIFIILPFYFNKIRSTLFAQSEEAGPKKSGRKVVFKVLWVAAICLLVSIASNRPPQTIMGQWGLHASRNLTHSMVSNGHGLDSLLARATSVFPLAAPVLAAVVFGPEAALFSVGQTVVAAYLTIEQQATFPAFVLSGIRAVHMLPWWCIAVIAAMCSAALLWRFLMRLCACESPRQRRLLTLCAVASTALIISMEFLPLQLAIHATAFLVTVGLGWIVILLIRKTEPRIETFMSGSMGFFIYLVGIVAALYFAAPGTSSLWALHQLWPFLSRLSDILLYCVGLAVVLHLLTHVRQTNHLIHDEISLHEGVFLFAALLTGVTTWMGIPIALLIALMVPFVWMFRPRKELLEIEEELENHHGAITAVFSETLRRLISLVRYNGIVSNLQAQMEKATITPDQFEEKRTAVSRVLLGGDGHQGGEQLLHRQLLSIGAGNAWENVYCALKAGLVLAAPLIAMSLISELHFRQPRFPFPIADFMIFMVMATMRYMLYSFVFGFFYAHIRGSTGLTKGAVFAVAIILPFAVYQIITLRDMSELRAFSTWAAQIFLFCIMLGLWVGDVRLLKKNGYGIKEVLYLHNVPMLSAYSSAVAAAIGAAIIPLVTGSAQDLTKFFISAVLNR